MGVAPSDGLFCTKPHSVKSFSYEQGMTVDKDENRNMNSGWVDHGIPTGLKPVDRIWLVRSGNAETNFH